MHSPQEAGVTGPAASTISRCAGGVVAAVVVGLWPSLAVAAGERVYRSGSMGYPKLKGNGLLALTRQRLLRRMLVGTECT